MVTLAKGREKLLALIGIIIFLGSVGQIFLNITSALKERNFIDFSVYTGAVGIFLQGENPYNFLYSEDIPGIAFNYPPSSLLVLSPLSLFPLRETQIVFTFLSLGFLWLTIWIIWKLSRVELSIAHFFLLLAFFNQTFPVKFTLILGQINLFVLGLSFGSIYLYTYKKRMYKILACIMLAAAASVKLFPLYILPVFFLKKDYLFFLFVLALFLVTNGLVSWDLTSQYYFQIAPTFSHIGKPNYYDQSIFAFLYRLSNNTMIAKNVGLSILAFFYGSAFYYFYRFRLEKKYAGDIFLTTIALIFAIVSIGNFFSWQHHLVFAYPLVFFLYLKSVKSIKQKQNTKRKILFTGVFIFIWFTFFFHFKNERVGFLANPFIASYQTLMVLTLIIFQLSLFYKDMLKRSRG